MITAAPGKERKWRRNANQRIAPKETPQGRWLLLKFRRCGYRRIIHGVCGYKPGELPSLLWLELFQHPKVLVFVIGHAAWRMFHHNEIGRKDAVKERGG
jgi:hypothetical protein